MASAPGTLRFGEIATTPPAPPAGYALFYVKTDNVVYVQDSSGTEIPLGSASAITELTGDVVAVGPGITAATVTFVGGASAADIASATATVLAATSAATPNTLVKRDGSGGFSANAIVAGSVAATGTVTGSNLSGTNTGDVTLGTANGLSLLGQALSLALASASTTGALSSTDWNTFNNKVESSDNRLFAQNTVRVKTNPGLGEFSNLKDALDSITTASITDRYTIEWYPGNYIEDNSAGPILLKPYVSITAMGDNTVVVDPQDPLQDLFLVNGSAARLSKVTIQNVTGPSTAGIRVTQAISPFIMDLVTMINCTEHIVVEATSQPSNVTVFNARHISGSATTRFVRLTSSLAQPAVMRAYALFGTDDNGTSFDAGLYLSGTGARIDANNLLLRSTVSIGNGITLRDGAEFVSQTGGEIEKFDKNLWVENFGAAPILRSTTVMFRLGVTADIQIDHVGTMGSLMAKANTDTKVFVDISAPIKLVLTDPAANNSTGIFIKGDILQADRFDRRANLSLIARSATTLGLLDDNVGGGAITVVSGLQINIAAGTGFLNDPVDVYLKQIEWPSTNLTLSASTDNYIYVDTNAIIQVNSVLPSLETVIPLGRVVAGASVVDFIEHSALIMNQIGNKTENLLRDALGPIFAAGAIVTENATPLKLDVSAGEYFYGSTNLVISGGSAISWESIYRDGSGGFIFGTQSTTDNAFYDDGSGALASLSAANYAKHTLYVVGDGGAEKYFLVYSQAQYAALVDAQNAPLPLVPGFIQDAVVRVAGVIVQQGQPNINSTIDLRPRLGFAAPATTAASDHRNLTHLDSDDHLQYLNRSGVRPMTGPLTSTDTTDAVSPTTGSVILAGGIGVSKNINAGGTIIGSNLSGTNSGDVTILDTDSIDLTLTGQQIQASLKLSSDAADASNIKATVSVHSGGSPGLHVELPFATPVQIGTSNNVGSNPAVALSDHVHAHGNQTSGTLHAAVTSLVNGFMSTTDKVKLDASTNLNTASTLVQRDASGNFTAGTITANLTGNASGSAATITGNLTGDVTSVGMATTIAVGVVTDTKASLAVKPAVAVVSITNLVLSGLQTIDGVTVAANTLVLLTAQTTGSENGPWQAQSGAWTRPTWYPTGGTTQAFQFITTFVRLGTTYQGSVWRMTTAGAITIGTTSTTWAGTPLALNSSTVSGILPNANTTGTTSNTANTLVLRDANGNIATGVIFPTTTKTANYTITAADGIIFCDTSGGAFNLTLPAPASSAGKWFRVIDTKGTFGANNLTLVRNASEKIEGLAASKALQTNWGFFNITCDGTDWYVG